ncbi:calcium-translocating P-type ATPase [Streptomyces sp. SLBN-118]|uniref:cation-translocating P-type ATPase n=1 Tax=Streptomyces sp. SLBN-118 TaxID=2768454 RepID=UPI001154D584|nr:cation-transporting P-type ATPase [Streptomyces sp. SLBN-118]TQK50000.1 calcium-translocating P-type ATPase [Streptomyces sp. SLBN-118]
MAAPTDVLTPGGSGGETSGDADGLAIRTLPPTDVYSALDTSPRGLTTEAADTRLRRFGSNELPRAAHPAMWRQLAAQFTDLFAVVLLVASAITALAYTLQEPRDPGTLQLAVAILAVVVLNASIGFAQEYSAERTAESLQAMVPHTCRVLRDAVLRELPARELVRGDVVILEAGDAVSADCRLVEAHDITVNNAAITGESDAVGRGHEPDQQGPVLEARNCLFMGTDVVAGTAKAVVFATGRSTEFGRIFQLTAAAPRQKTPLQHQVASMARRVAGAALAVGSLLFAVRLPAGQDLVSAFVFALGVMVALVPEGLPATLSVSLAIGVRRMARRHALVKQLLAVEALGSTTVVCTDKTGTLTQAEMTVVQVWAGGVMHTVSGVGYEPAGEVTDPEPVRAALRAAALCSNARLVPPSDGGRWHVLGDTTEGALLVAAAKAGLDRAAEEAAAPRVGEHPFDSVRKLMSTVHSGDHGYHACVKGAPQELLERCTAIDRQGEVIALTDALRAEVMTVNDELATQGLRVLAAARRELSGPHPDRDTVESGLTFLGLVGMLDPPRPEVREAVAACHRAGIRVVMVTGDHPLTAEAVARRVGIVRHSAPTVVTGARLNELDDDALDGLLAGQGDLLLCRVSPEHKMRVVTAFQRRLEVVAVTGDGANDAPALKHADIGVAMGASGTDVAREAAVMVLLDDSFASIATAVRLGRSVYQNIRKFLVYVFSSNIGELGPIIAATFAGFPLVPISAVQILAIDLGSDVLPALALGAERPEDDVMDRPPRSRHERLFSAAVMGRILFLGGIQALCGCAVFFWHVNGSGIPFSHFTEDNAVYREAITLVQAGIVISQFFIALTLRTERESVFRAGLLSNPWLLAAGGIGLVWMSGISYWPLLQNVFNTAPIAVTDWAVLAVLGVLPLAADEARKWSLRRRHSSRTVEQGGKR